MIGYGHASKTDLRLVRAEPQGAGQALELEIFGGAQALTLPLMGEFQAMNALAALGLAVATGVPADVALDALAQLQGAPGRMEHVASHPNGAPVIVDYAHTPDALETALLALRPHCRQDLVVVFGCGGDRDRGKRPLMGEVATRLADRVIVTDDNPRSEDPAAIRRAILAGAPDALEIGDRGLAIREAVKALAPDDLLLIAGKGHETGQTIAGWTHPFDDSAEARAAAEAVR